MKGVENQTSPLGAFRIVYIGGWMRSGTTLLCEMVGAFDGSLALGELSGLWRAAHRGHRCSCGELIVECQVWGPALAEVAARHGVGPDDYADFAALVKRTLRTRSALSLVRLDPQAPDTWPAETRHYTEVMDTLLRSVMRTTGARVLVDSSKLPPGYLIYRLLPGTRVDVLHVIRDARAVASSERRTRARHGVELELLPPGRSPLSSVIQWSIFNLAVMAFARWTDGYQRISYETLTSHVDQELNRIATCLGLVRTPGRTLGNGHLAVGNPTRMEGSRRTVTTDVSWRSELSRRDRALVTVLCTPARVLLRER